VDERGPGRHAAPRLGERPQGGGAGVPRRCIVAGDGIDLSTGLTTRSDDPSIVSSIAEAIRRIGANGTSLVGSLGPVFTIGMGAVILGEPLHAVQLLGAALVLAGVLLVTRRPSLR
jgi:hypothetical protein